MKKKNQKSPKVGACYCLLEQPNGKYLFEKRSLSSKWQPGKWILPGGKIDRGETPKQAIKREIKEETGQIATCLELFCIDNTTINIKGIKIPITRAYFTGKAKGKIKINQESCDYKIITLKKAKKLKLIPTVKKIINKFEKCQVDQEN